MVFQFLKERRKVTEDAHAFISVVHNISFARVKDASNGPHCEASVSPDSNFCPRCGKKLIYAYMKVKLLDFELGFAIHNSYVRAKERWRNLGKLTKNMEWKLMENRMRSVLKSLSFRLFATLMTVVLVLVFTRDTLVSFEIGAIEFFGKIALYYFHERLWNMFPFGRMSPSAGMCASKNKKDVIKER